jgi:hypothetical protein
MSKREFGLAAIYAALNEQPAAPSAEPMGAGATKERSHQLLDWGASPIETLNAAVDRIGAINSPPPGGFGAVRTDASNALDAAIDRLVASKQLARAV